MDIKNDLARQLSETDTELSFIEEEPHQRREGGRRWSDRLVNNAKDAWSALRERFIAERSSPTTTASARNRARSAREAIHNDKDADILAASRLVFFAAIGGAVILVIQGVDSLVTARPLGAMFSFGLAALLAVAGSKGTAIRSVPLSHEDQPVPAENTAGDTGSHSHGAQTQVLAWERPRGGRAWLRGFITFCCFVGVFEIIHILAMIGFAFTIARKGIPAENPYEVARRRELLVLICLQLLLSFSSAAFWCLASLFGLRLARLFRLKSVATGRPMETANQVRQLEEGTAGGSGGRP